jgi:hypothetical protein
VPLALLALLARWQRRWAVPIAIACIGLSQITPTPPELMLWMIPLQKLLSEPTG